MFKLAFWVAILGGGVFVGGQVIPIYYNNLKIQNIFEGVSENLSTQSSNEVESRMNELFKIQTIDMKLLPSEFFENLSITKEDGKLQIASEYRVVLWLLGPPLSVNPDEEYKESEVELMDKVRLRMRMDFNFAPFAESP